MGERVARSWLWPALLVAWLLAGAAVTAAAQPSTPSPPSPAGWLPGASAEDQPAGAPGTPAPLSERTDPVHTDTGQAAGPTPRALAARASPPAPDLILPTVPVPPGWVFCSGVTDVSVDECLALWDLYGATNGSHWTQSGGWLTSETISSWFGVTVSGGHVTGLALGGTNGNGLSGQLPDLSGLAWLQVLELPNNRLNGPMPDLSSLTSLQKLDLENDQLTGSIPSLSTLTGLQSLVLSYNGLTQNLLPLLRF